MKLYPSFRYQLWDQRTAILIYYAILASLLLVSLIAMPFLSTGGSFFASANGVTAVTVVFAFILSLCAFKDSFLMNLQQGISRRSQFLARLGAMGVVCAVMAVADEVYTLLLAGLHMAFPDSFLSHSLYGMIYGDNSGFSILLSIIFSFFLLLAVCSLGYLVTVFMYRLNKLGKIIFWVGTPFVCILFLSHIVTHMYGKLAVFLGNIVQLCFGTLPRMAMTCTLVTALFSALTWLLMRRAAVK